MWPGLIPSVDAVCGLSLLLPCSEGKTRPTLAKFKASRDGAVVRALASHQCGLGMIPGVDANCGVSLLSVLVPASKVFLWVPWFSSLHKSQHSKFQFDLETVDERATLWKPL